MLSARFHPLNFIIIPLIWLSAAFSAKHAYCYGLILFIAGLNLVILNTKISWRNLGWFSVCLSPALAALFISSYLFVGPIPTTMHISKEDHLMFSCILCLRLFTLSIVSFAYMYHLPKERVILSLAQTKILPVKIAYSLLAVFNAFTYLGQEFKRIQLAYQMRYQQLKIAPIVIFPLLVAAARYAHSLSISMYNRGLNQNRSYYNQQPKLNYRDYLLWTINLTLLLFLLTFDQIKLLNL